MVSKTEYQTMEISKMMANGKLIKAVVKKCEVHNMPLAACKCKRS